MSSYDHFSANGSMGRNTVIALAVVLLHVGALWALQSGLLRRAVEVIVPAELLSEFIAPPAPQVAPPPPPAPPAPQAAPRVKAPRPAPMPLAITDPTPAPSAPLGVTTPVPAAPAPEPVAAPAPPAPAAPPAPPAPPRIELPSSNAAYLQNPAPAYPGISRRMGEQGKVVLRVLISAEGRPEKVEISQSSGYERLDRQAQDTVMRWRFVPGKRNGVPEAMWYLVPVNFVLE